MAGELCFLSMLASMLRATRAKSVMVKYLAVFIGELFNFANPVQDNLGKPLLERIG